MNGKPIWWACFCALLAGCAVNPPPVLSEAGKAVQIEKAYFDVKECKSYGIILARAASLMGDVGAEQETDARNKAGAMGGNRILPRQLSVVLEPGTRQYEVFSCP